MRICQDHWTKLREAIDKKGLSHLVAKSGHEAATRLIAEMTEGEAPYDPLMSCNNMIVSNALNILGLELMNKECCPICEVLKYLENDWIEGPSNAALNYCKEHNLL